MRGVEVAQLVDEIRATAEWKNGDWTLLHVRHASLDVRAARGAHAGIERVLADACRRRALPVLGFYDVNDLIAKIGDFPRQEIELVPSNYRPPTAEPALDLDQLIDSIRATVAPGSWDTVDGAEIQSKHNVLVVTTTRAVHGRIARYLCETRGKGFACDCVIHPSPSRPALLERLERGLPNPDIRE